MKVTSLPSGSNSRSARKRSASVVGDDSQSLAATGPVISRLLVIGGVREGQAVAGRVVVQGCRRAGRLRRQRQARPAADNIWSIACARAAIRSRRAARTFRRGWRMLSDTARLLVPAGIFALEKMAEEALLQRLAVIAVEMREVRVAVHLEPFLLGAGAQIAFEIAAGVQPHAAPIGGRKQRRVDLREIGGARCVIIVDEFAPLRFARRVGAVFGELCLRQRVGAGDRVRR